ncbi:hypothetical protein U2F58_09925 [Lactobacillus johnsonii]|uniref:hypothetical protein n=1 Tax=Lactobacillus johnsonii TaxID=33959 RepID=UPI0026166756
MARLVKVSGRGDGTTWKSALKDLQPDDVLLLAPGFYELDRGLEVNNITIKGTGSTPEETVINGFFVLESNCNFFTLENIALQTKSGHNTIYVDDAADTYLTLRNTTLYGDEDDMAAIAVNGKCTLELFSSKILNSSVSLFAQADFRLTMTDSLIDYDSENYAALGIQGKGTAIISNSIIHGNLSTYPNSNAEVDLNNTTISYGLIHGQTWVNMLNSTVEKNDDSSFYISDDSWVNILQSKFKGGIFLDKNTRTLIQNSKIDRLIACDNAKVTLNNSTIISHADFQDKVTADATRVAFSGRDDFEYFLALSGQATLGGRDLIINPNGSRLAVQDDAKIKLNIVSSSAQDLEVECNSRPNINILGMRWEAKKNND